MNRAFVMTFLGAFLMNTSALADTASPQDELAMPSVTVERSFVSGPFGQMHIRIARPTMPTTKTPLVLFHPTPYSGDYFKEFMQFMAQDRVVIAIDTPGYGDSDLPPEPQSIYSYAGAVVVALGELGFGERGQGALDMMGYHTGTLIATDVAAIRPDLVHRLVLPGVPFYLGEARQEAYHKYVQATVVKVDGAHLDSKWEFAKTAVPAGLSIERVQEHFNDMAQCFPHCWWAYEGVFTYAPEERFPKVSQPVLLISFAGSLTEETVQAQTYFPNASILNMENATLGAFQLIPERIAEETRKFLDND